MQRSLVSITGFQLTSNSGLLLLLSADSLHDAWKESHTLTQSHLWFDDNYSTATLSHVKADVNMSKTEVVKLLNTNCVQMSKKIHLAYACVVPFPAQVVKMNWKSKNLQHRLWQKHGGLLLTHLQQQFPLRYTSILRSWRFAVIAAIAALVHAIRLLVLQHHCRVEYKYLFHSAHIIIIYSIIFKNLFIVNKTIKFLNHWINPQWNKMLVAEN